MLGDRFVKRLIEEKILTDKNIERLVKYYWVISTARMVLGVTILILILFEGYKLSQLIPWR